MTGNALGWLNAGLAVLGMLAAFGAVNKMQWGKTKPCVIWAVLLIAVGLAGQWLWFLKEEWVQYADTALYGGVLALVLATQRQHTWCLERWANPIASTVVLIAGAVFVLGLLSGCQEARAQDLSKPHLVVALDQLDRDAIYARSVMLAVPAPNGGHYGFIINKPTKHTLAETFPDYEPAKAVAEPLFLGGPFLPQAVFAVTRSQERPSETARQMLPSVWLVIRSAEVDAVIEKSPNDARYYIGAVFWRPGELAEEARRGLVMLRPADPEKLFRRDTSQLYDELVTPNRRPRVET